MLKYKKTTILAIIFTALTVSIILFYCVFFNTTYYRNIDIVSTGDNNAYQNACVNNGARLVRINDKLYYNYYGAFVTELLKTGTYEISENFQKRVFCNGIDISPVPKLLDLNNIWNNKLLLGERHLDIENNIVKYYDLTSSKIKTAFSFDNIDGIEANRYLVVDNQRYFYSKDNSFYKLNDDSNVDLIYSTQKGDFEYYSDPKFNNGYIYFLAGNYAIGKSDWYTWEMEGVENIYFCKYSIKDKKIVDKMLYSPETERYDGTYKDYTMQTVINDKIFATACDQNNKFQELVYVADMKRGTNKIIFEASDETGVIINSYNDKVFACMTGGKDAGIYKIDTETYKFTKIHDPLSYNDLYEINDLYILDDKYLYFIGSDNNTLYRITQDGKNLEKVFG